MRRLKKTTWVIMALSFLVVGFWWNLQALWAYMHNLPSLKILGDILPFKLSVGDCFLFLGYAIFTVLLGVLAGCLIGKLALKLRGRSRGDGVK
ncbi:hypothetical protein ES708_07228 [subsurface metagenome]